MFSSRDFWPTLHMRGIAKESENLTRSTGTRPTITPPRTHLGHTLAPAAPQATSSPHFPIVRSNQESTSLHHIKGLTLKHTNEWRRFFFLLKKNKIIPLHSQSLPVGCVCVTFGCTYLFSLFKFYWVNVVPHHLLFECPISFLSAF